MLDCLITFMVIYRTSRELTIASDRYIIIESGGRRAGWLLLLIFFFFFTTKQTNEKVNFGWPNKYSYYQIP